MAHNLYYLGINIGSLLQGGRDCHIGRIQSIGKAYKWSPPKPKVGHIWLVDGEFTVNISVWDEAGIRDFCTVSSWPLMYFVCWPTGSRKRKDFEGQPATE